MVVNLEANLRQSSSTSPPVRFVVGIGASAGGLKSLERLFKSLENETGSAFVVVQHISPDGTSSMDEILKRYTEMRVVSVQQQMRVEPDTIYLIPAGKEIRLEGMEFEVSVLDRDQIARPVDTFFHSLAGSFGANSIGIVLSGTGSDGSDGIKAIHDAKGSTIVESLDTAQFDGMPRNAIATNSIDMVLSPEEMSMWLSQQFADPANRPAPVGDLDVEELTGVNLIFSLLAKRHDIEFSFYKPATVARRIERRRLMCHCTSILDYAEFVKDHVEELDLLYFDLLIGVTKFFRDTEAFSKLEAMLHEKIAALDESEEFRVWVAGCATGEEPYSIAMLCCEAFEKIKREPRFKIFATDAHTGSLEHASKGIYKASSMEYVGNDRQQKFFIQDDENQFRVGTQLRRHMVFARHNVVQDPPFTRMDLVTCRNLLIYLQPAAQIQAISSFHFALKRVGIMMLGSSESPGKLADEFEVIDETWKIYCKLRNLPTLNKNEPELSLKMPTRPRRLVNLLNNDRPETMSFTGLIEGYDLILKEFISSGVMLDDKRNVLHVFGDANRYLNSNSGRFTGNLMGFLSGESKISIAAALTRASTEIGVQIILEGLKLPVNNGAEECVNLHVKAIHGHSVGAFIWFLAFHPQLDVEPAEEDLADREAIRITLASDAYTAMESELIHTKESLSATIQEVETSNEELQAANEQLIAANEELQSTNEELHSVNEELYSVNAENQRKISQLEEMTDDVDNLLASTDIGIIFLDSQMQIRKFTRAASAYIKLQSHDIGRKITDFATHVKFPKLYDKISETIEIGQSHTETVATKDNSPVLVRVMPYMSGKKIKGAIVNFIEINEDANS